MILVPYDLNVAIQNDPSWSCRSHLTTPRRSQNGQVQDLLAKIYPKKKLMKNEAWYTNYALCMEFLSGQCCLCHTPSSSVSNVPSAILLTYRKISQFEYIWIFKTYLLKQTFTTYEFMKLTWKTTHFNNCAISLKQQLDAEALKLAMGVTGSSSANLGSTTNRHPSRQWEAAGWVFLVI